MVECPAKVCAACEGCACVAGPSCTVDQEEGARGGDADAEGHDVGEDEVGKVQKGGNPEQRQGRGRDGRRGEKGVYGSEVVDECKHGGLGYGRGRDGGRCGGGIVVEGEDEEERDGEKESGGSEQRSGDDDGHT